MKRGMPIKNPGMSPLPWSIIEPHKAWAQKNHGQTLEQLAQRGGLTACEAVAIIENRPWHRMTETGSILRLTELIRRAREKLEGGFND